MTYINGIHIESEPKRFKKLMVSNPKGYNRYKKNPNPIKKEVEIITKESVQEAYRQFLYAKRNLLSKAQRYHRMFKMFLELDKVDKEFKELELKE